VFTLSAARKRKNAAKNLRKGIAVKNVPDANNVKGEVEDVNPFYIFHLHSLEMFK
jgi:hypothetical protein